MFVSRWGEYMPLVVLEGEWYTWLKAISGGSDIQWEFTAAPEWINAQAFVWWLKAVEVFSVVGLFVLAYVLIKAINRDEDDYTLERGNDG